MSIHDINRSIDGLTYTMRQAWLELAARCTEQRVWIVLLETLRTPERLEWLIANGKSWSRRSYHLAGPDPDAKAAALDAAPILGITGGTLKIINWDADHRHWGIYVGIAKAIGLECGAEWSQADWSHVQLQRRR